MIEIPKTLKVNLIIQLSSSNRLVAYANDDCLPDGFVNIKKVELIVDIPEMDIQEINGKRVAVLAEEKARILSTAHVQAQNIQDQIDRMLAIEHKPTFDVDVENDGVIDLEDFDYDAMPF